MRSVLLCGSCGHSQVAVGTKIVDSVYYPNRMVYVDAVTVRCEKCTKSTDMIIKGENYISALSIGYKEYYTNPNIVESNIDYYKKRISKEKNEATKVKYIDNLNNYLNIVASHRNKEMT